MTAGRNCARCGAALVAEQSIAAGVCVSCDYTHGAANLGALGYEPSPSGGWKLVRPEARPPECPGLCRKCRKYDELDPGLGWCAGCLWFGPGDPHGLRAKARDRDKAPARLPLEDPGVVRRRLRAGLRRRLDGSAS